MRLVHSIQNACMGDETLHKSEFTLENVLMQKKNNSRERAIRVAAILVGFMYYFQALTGPSCHTFNVCVQRYFCTQPFIYSCLKPDCFLRTIG